MALQIIIGDLLSNVHSSNALIVHGCNAKGVMGSGFAKLIKDQFPHAFLSYKQAHKRKGLKLGEVIVWRNTEDGPSVANAITQEDYGRDNKVYVCYDAVVVALQAVAKYAKENGLQVHLPLIGGGLARGDVKRLKAIFRLYFGIVTQHFGYWRNDANTTV